MLLHEELTEDILDAFYEVYNDLGHGFLEKVYQNALFFELKAVDSIIDAHKKQLQNYLKASSIEVGLILNFGKKPSFHRSVFFNEAKTNLPLFKKQ